MTLTNEIDRMRTLLLQKPREPETTIAKALLELVEAINALEERCTGLEAEVRDLRVRRG